MQNSQHLFYCSYIFFTCIKEHDSEEPDQISETPNYSPLEWHLESSKSFKIHQTLPKISVKDDNPVNEIRAEHDVKNEYKAVYPPSLSCHRSIEQSDNYRIVPIGVCYVQTFPVRFDLSSHCCSSWSSRTT